VSRDDLYLRVEPISENSESYGMYIVRKSTATVRESTDF
jgi:hypothetical protein